MKGRTVPPQREFTFPDSEITVQLRRIGPRTLEQIYNQITKSHPAPKPPTVVLEIGESRTKVEEEDRRDPEFLKATAVWQLEMKNLTGQAIYDLIVDYAIIPEIDPDAIKTLRDTMAARGSPLIDAAGEPLSDRRVYIEHLCFATGDDISSVTSAVLNNSRPTEAGVETHVAGFQGTV